MPRMPNRTYRRITYADRVRIETMYNRFGMNPLAIAKELGFCNLLDWHTSEDLFISELSALGINFFDFFRKTS